MEPSSLPDDFVDNCGKFDRQYFEGGLPEGGGYGSYNAEGRGQDADRIISLMPDPQSFIDVGGAYGKVCGEILLRRPEILALTLDVSMWAAEKDLLEHIVASATHIPFKDKSFDCAYSNGMLEHIPEELVDLVVSEIDRIARRGVLIISYLTGDDKTHRTIKPAEWWAERIPEKFFIAATDPWDLSNTIRGRRKSG